MRNQKLYFIITVLLFAVLLSGCTKIDISIGIDADFTSYLTYRIELDVDNVDIRYHNALKRALNEIGWYYQEELNFVAELNIDTNPYYVVMTRRMQNNSFEQAYQSLNLLLTNENITPFMTVDMAFQATERQSNYIFNATTDIPHIMSLSNAEELSPALQEQLNNALKTGEGTITLTLPAGEQFSSSHEVSIQNNQTVMVAPLSFTEQTNLELTGMVNTLRNGTPGGSLHEVIQEQYRLRSIAIIACFAVFVILLITILIIVLRKRKT